MPKEKRHRFAGIADKKTKQTKNYVRRFLKKLVPGRSGTYTENDIQTEFENGKKISCLEYLSQPVGEDIASTTDNVLQDRPGPGVNIVVEEANVVSSNAPLQKGYRSCIYVENATENIFEEYMSENLIQKEENIFQNIHHNEAMNEMKERDNKTRLEKYQANFDECILAIDQKESLNETIKTLEEHILRLTEYQAKQDECILSKDRHITTLTEKKEEMEARILNLTESQLENETLCREMKKVIGRQREKIEKQAQDHGIVVEHLVTDLYEEIQNNCALIALTNTLKLDKEHLQEQIEQLKQRKYPAKRRQNHQRFLQRKRSQMKRSGKRDEAKNVYNLLATNVYLNCTQSINVLKCPSDSSETSSSSRRSIFSDMTEIKDEEMMDTWSSTPLACNWNSSADNEITSQPVYFQTPFAAPHGAEEHVNLARRKSPSVSEINQAFCEYPVEVSGGNTVLPLDQLPISFVDVTSSTLACCENKFGKLLDALKLPRKDVPEMLDGGLSEHDKQDITSQALQTWRNLHLDGHIKTTELAIELYQIIEAVLK